MGRRASKALRSKGLFALLDLAPTKPTSPDSVRRRRSYHASAVYSVIRGRASPRRLQQHCRPSYGEIQEGDDNNLGAELTGQPRTSDKMACNCDRQKLLRLVPAPRQPTTWEPCGRDNRIVVESYTARQGGRSSSWRLQQRRGAYTGKRRRGGCDTSGCSDGCPLSGTSLKHRLIEGV